RAFAFYGITVYSYMRCPAVYGPLATCGCDLPVISGCHLMSVAHRTQTFFIFDRNSLTIFGRPRVSAALNCGRCVTLTPEVETMTSYILCWRRNPFLWYELTMRGKLRNDPDL